MPQRYRSLAIAVYALLVIGSGVLRYATAEGGGKALWFGIVMGGLSLVGAALHHKGLRRVGLGVTFVVLAFVGGWFGYEAFVRKGLAAAEVRQLVIFGLSLVLAVLLLRPARR